MTPAEKSQALFDRAQVPLHQAVLAIANILGEDHELFAEGQLYRGKVNALIESLRPKGQVKK